MTECSTPDGIGERLLRLQAQAVARDHQQTRSTVPDAIRRAAAITGSSDLPPPGGDGGENVACVGLAVGDRLDNAGEVSLVGAERARGQAEHRNDERYPTLNLSESIVYPGLVTPGCRTIRSSADKVEQRLLAEPSGRFGAVEQVGGHVAFVAM